MVATFAFASLAMDYGHAQGAKTELRRAADAGARAAASMLGNVTTCQNLAYQFAYANTCDGAPVVIDKAADVEFIDWDTTTRTYTVLSGATAQAGANAIRVTCRRTQARGNAVPLYLGRVLGQYYCDVQASAIAACIPPGYGLIGLNYINLKGNSSTSYWSSTGAIGGNAGHIASNGPITSSGTSTIQGSVWHLAGQPVSGVTATNIRTMAAPLVFPNGDSTPYSKTNNDDNQFNPYVSSVPDLSIPNGKNVIVAGGHYWFKNVTVASNASITFTGPATIYFYGTFSMSGPANTSGNSPKNLSIVAMPSPTGAAPGSITFGSSGALYANVYAPQSDITVSGSGSIYGSVLGKSVSITGTADIYYDLSSSGGSGVVQMVR